jgi:hypothetical protein
MITISRTSGLQITIPANYSIAVPDKPQTSRRRGKPGRVLGPVPLPKEVETAVASDAVVAAFSNQDMELIDEIELVPDTSAKVRAGRARTSKTAEFNLTMQPDEDAVILLEQDGVYTWQFASKSKTQSIKSRKRGIPTDAAKRAVQFSIKLPVGKPAKRRSARRGIIEDFALDKIKAFIFKFAARVAVGQVMKYLERDLRHGLVEMTNIVDPAKWDLVTTSLKLPVDRPARILLFIHGIFSSTIGAYGSLTATAWGQEFLRAARANYDAVIGFDHATLSEDPLENANDLLGRLEAIHWKYPPHVDVITHSRGGLVIRSLLEELLPLVESKVHFERIIFVAAPNGGTNLAKPDNWSTLIDLYTNIAVAACKLIGMNPQAKAFTLILNEIISGLGAFVKYCATTPFEKRAVPGVAAMEPDGNFIKKLNERQKNQPTIEQSYYYAITSNFHPRIFSGEHEPKEFPLRLLLWTADVLSGQFMKQGSDLAVDITSMTNIDPQVGKYVRDSYDFGINPQVYHTNYFIRPETVNALTRWLRLPKPATRVTRPQPRATWQPDAVSVGGVAAADVPAAVDTDILVTQAVTPVGEAVKMIEQTNASYVVIRRAYKGDVLDYAFKAEEVLQSGGGFDEQTPLITTLNLHETDRSKTRSVSAPMKPQVSRPKSRTLGRAVILEGNQPVGVLPEPTTLPSTVDLVTRIDSVASPGTIEEAIMARRTLPSFSPKAVEVAKPTRPRYIIKRGGPGHSRKRMQERPKVICHFRADMEQDVVINRPATVEVTVSRELIGRLVRATAAERAAEVDPNRKLLIQVLPKINFESMDEGWVEIDPPQPGIPQQLYFMVRATHAGDGELLVVARQGQVPLVTLVLRPQIVKSSIKPTRRAVATATTAEAPRLAAPLHQLTIFETAMGDKISYLYILQAPALDLLLKTTSAPLKGNRQEYVAELYQEIENRWLDNQDDVDAFTADLRAMGGDMFDQLIPKDLQQILWDYRNKIKSIMVISEEPFIPWELIHLKEPGKPLSKEGRFLGQMGVVRWLHEAGWPPDQLRIRVGRASYVIPNYPHPDYELPEAEKEGKFLENQFGATAVQPKSSAVRKLISQPGAFDLLHFACHGTADQDNIANAQLFMEGRVDGSQYIPEYFSATTAEQYANLKEDGKAPIIVINACQAGRAGYKLTGVGGFAQAFLRRGAGVFVSTLWSVGDSPARQFTEEFYRQIHNGVEIAQATIKAREKARKAGDATWLAYVVYGHPHSKVKS